MNQTEDHFKFKKTRPMKKQLIAITFTVLVGEEVTDEDLKENKSLLRDLTKKIFKTNKVQVTATYETQE